MSRNVRVSRLLATALKRAPGDKESLRDDIGKLVDGAIGAVCVYCDCLLSLANVSLDHKTPISRGGQNDAQTNLQIICRRCNQAKGAFTDQEFFAIVKAVEPFGAYCRQYLYTRLMAATRVFRRWRK